MPATRIAGERLAGGAAAGAGGGARVTIRLLAGGPGEEGGTIEVDLRPGVTAADALAAVGHLAARPSLEQAVDLAYAGSAGTPAPRADSP